MKILQGISGLFYDNLYIFLIAQANIFSPSFFLTSFLQMIYIADNAFFVLNLYTFQHI